MPERFRLPWSIHELEESFVVRTADEVNITWFHFAVRPPPIGTKIRDRMTKQQAYAMARLFVKAAQAKAEGKL
jgi:hypothetical protein